MKLLRSAPLLLAGLTACQAAPSQRDTAVASATTGSPVDDHGTDDPPGFAMRPDPATGAPLTAATFSEILPPSWHVGETWEVMFCTANSEWTRRGEFDTTRVIFRVVAVPEPGAYTAVVEVKQHMFPYEAWVGELFTINGVRVARGASRVILDKSVAQEMRFDGETFDSMLPLVHDRYGRATVDYESIGDHLDTSRIRDFTPHVPSGLSNPEITEPTTTSFQVRRTITSTPDGLVYQAEEGTETLSRRTVFWRRGESWWSYARADAVALRDPADADGGEYRAPDGNTSFAWAIKLPLGEPASLNCNSKH